MNRTIRHAPGKLTVVAFLSVFSALVLGPASLRAQPIAWVEEEPGGPVYWSGQVLIQFKRTATDAQLQDAVRRSGLGLLRHILTDAMRVAGEPGISRMSTALTVRQAIQTLRNHPAIDFVEPNWVYAHQDISNDPFFTGGSLWGLYGDASSPGNVYGSQAAEAWSAGYTGSSSVLVGVVDEGVQVAHPDLAPNIWMNPHDPSDGTDNDGNGYVDDVHGWDFYQNNSSVYDGTADDHGTHVTGTIGAVGGNGLGVAGVNWAVTLIAAKFLGPNGGSTADAIEAIDYFTDLKLRHDLNLVALNSSWGGGGYSQGLHDAIIRAAKAGILFVAAAGNGDRFGRALNNDSRAFYPANYDTSVGTSTETAASYNAVIAVTAIDSAGNKAGWANYGASKVHLGAPGVAINSTLPTSTYGSYSGTSMATPHVTGAVALYASTHPGASAAEIRVAILNSTAPTASLAGRTTTGGRLDLSTVIGPPASSDDRPSPPSGLSATGGDARVTLTWNASSGATSYNVYRRQGSDVTFQFAASVTTTTHLDTGLANGTTYHYIVTALNSVGASDPSNEASATPVGPAQAPAAPSELTALAVSSSQIHLSWTDNSNNETGFKIERSTDNRSYTQIATVGAGVTTFSDTGLSRNRRYYYRVRAYNEFGNSTYSNTANARTRAF
jgi:subtilisin family serine protease